MAFEPAGAILTLNAGSSSLKWAIFAADTLDRLGSGQIDGIGAAARLQERDGAGRLVAEEALEGADVPSDPSAALDRLMSRLGQNSAAPTIVAVGHRIVHGGLDHAAPVLLTAAIERALARLSPLAPLHQPHNLAGVAAARRAYPGVSQVGCFDTAFHRGHAFVDDAFALPRALYEEGVRRYGFHGLSYEYVSGRLAEIAPREAAGRVIIGHLGAGASLCALRGGRSVASTMGFSALDGLPMGTRPGQLDPGVLLYLITEKGLSAEALTDLLYRRSGLKGLSGISGDMRVLQASAAIEARQAIDYFVARTRREIGAMAAALGGLDAIVFTGGIGENAAVIRASMLDSMGWLGIELDPERNRAGSGLVSSDRSRVAVFVIPTDEELMIARHARALLQHDTDR